MGNGELAARSAAQVIATQNMRHDVRQPRTDGPTEGDDLAEMDGSQPYPFDLDATAW